MEVYLVNKKTTDYTGYITIKVATTLENAEILKSEDAYKYRDQNRKPEYEIVKHELSMFDSISAFRLLIFNDPDVKTEYYTSYDKAMEHKYKEEIKDSQVICVCDSITIFN